MRGKWNNSENNSLEWRGIFFIHSTVQENALKKRELFGQENSRNRIKIAKSLRISQAFVPGI